MGRPALARVNTKEVTSWRARETMQRQARRGQEATGPRTRLAAQRLPAGARPAWPQSARLGRSRLGGLVFPARSSGRQRKVLLAPLLDVTVAPDWTSCDAAQRFREIWTLHVAGSGTPCYSEELGDLRGADEILGHHHDRRAYPLA